MFAFAGLEILENFITDFEAFEVDDADVFGAMFPHLPLFKFQRHVGFWKTVSPDLNRGETVELFFLAGSLLAGDHRFFLCGGAVGLGCFLTGLLLVCFGGFISHNF
jgi:hypothetical protein